MSSPIESVVSGEAYADMLFTKRELGVLRKRVRTETVDGKVVHYVDCFVRHRDIRLTNEEVVRQLYARRLVERYRYPKRRVRFEYGVAFGKERKVADIVVFDGDLSERPYIVVEIKKPDVHTGKEQLHSYCNATGAPLGVWTNGQSVSHYRREGANKFEELADLPKSSRTADGVARSRWVRGLSAIVRMANTAVGRLVGAGAVLAAAVYGVTVLLPDWFGWSWSLLAGVAWLVALIGALVVRTAFVRCPVFWRYASGGLALALAAVIGLALAGWNGGELVGLAFSNGASDWLAFVPYEVVSGDFDWMSGGVAVGKVAVLLLVAVGVVEYSYVRAQYRYVRKLFTRRRARGGAEVSAVPKPKVSKKARDVVLPELDLLAPSVKMQVNSDEIEATRQKIVQSAKDHDVDIEIEKVFSGPAVTMYGIKPGWEQTRGAKRKKVKVNSIVSLEKDLALELGTANIRFETVVAGESVLGLEVPNKSAAVVNMRSVIDTEEWREFEQRAEIPLALGLGTGGVPVFMDMSKMPHILVAGTTGSGKSICINALITSVLMTKTPEQVRMVLIDPKRVELKHYQDVPHLATKVITEPSDAVGTLKALVKEMEQRMSLLEAGKARNIVAHNKKSKRKFPYILVVIDELADLMLVTAKEVESLLQRLAQLGRATGIHLVVATQRPSVDVITGLIKANFPSRISFALASQADSRTILDQAGGEKLLGYGDMLYAPIGANKPTRIKGILLRDSEIDAVIEHWSKYPVYYMPQIEVSDDDDAEQAKG